MSTPMPSPARPRSPWLALAALIAVALAPAAAQANTGRVVVMPFEGPVALADDTRAAIVNQVSRSYDVVAPTSWVKARRAAEEQELGAKVWARAAKKAKVDAVVEGKVVRRGKSAALELTVIDAHAGTEVDRTQITLAAGGLDERGADRVRRELDDLLGWVDGVASTRSIGDADLSDLEDLRDLDGEEPKARGRRGRAARPADDDDTDADDGAASDDDADEDDAGDEDADDADEDADDADEDADDADDADGARPRRGDEIMALFGEDAATTPAESARKAARARRVEAGVRRFVADAGAVAFERSRTFLGGPDAPLDYPGGVTTGLALAAAVYPTSRDPGGRLSGVGLSVEYARGLGATAAIDIGEDAPVDYGVIYQEWAAAAHYRHATPGLTIDGAVGYRSVTHVLDVVDELDDVIGAEVDALDGEFGSLTAGARVEFAASPTTTIGVGAEYLYVTSIGAISETAMLGGGQAWGARAQADVRVTLSRSAFVHAAATLQHYSVDFDGNGDMDADWEVDNVTDAFLGGQLGLGITY